MISTLLGITFIGLVVWIGYLIHKYNPDPRTPVGTKMLVTGPSYQARSGTIIEQVTPARIRCTYYRDHGRPETQANQYEIPFSGDMNHLARTFRQYGETVEFLT